MKKLNIGARIYAMGFAQLVLLLIVSILSLTQMDKIGKKLVDIAEEDIPLTRYLTVLTEHQLEQAVLFERALLYKSLLDQGDLAYKPKLDKIRTEIDVLSTKIDKEITHARAFATEAQNLAHSQATADELKKIAKELGVIGEHYQSVRGGLQNVLQQTELTHISDLMKLALKVEHEEDALKNELIALLDEIQSFTQQASLQAEHDEQAAIVWIAVVSGIAVLLAIITSFVIGRSITVPIELLIERLKSVASGGGDLTVKLDDSATDETGIMAREFNKFIENLRNLIGSTNEIVTNLSSSSKVANDVVQRTAQYVLDQKSQTEMVASAMCQMTSTTQGMSESTVNAAEATKSVREKVISGKHIASQTNDIIESLVGEMNDASADINSLVEETNNISTVLESIQSISEQTNLLALNAAIEAARAGETGRGFAVVADEVRTLASRTKLSTADIQDLLARLKTEANQVVVSMAKGTESATACLVKSRETRITLDEAAQSIDMINDLNMQIATATEQQSVVANDIDKNISNINNLASQTSSDANETAQVNQSMSRDIDELHSQFGRFVT